MPFSTPSLTGLVITSSGVYGMLDASGNVITGAATTLEIVWDFSDVMNGLMAFPNLISFLVLSGVIAEETFR